MYKTILCAIEATAEGKTVLAKAVELAKTNNGKVFVIHVMPHQVLPKDYQAELKQKITPKVEKIANAFDIPKKQQIVKVGKPYEQICQQAEKRKADLIVIGTHSKTGLKKLLGSSASAVANHADCDVTLVKV